MIIQTNSEKKTDTFEIKKTGEGESLFRNNILQFCPFQPGLIMPGQIQGQLQLQRTPCGNWCPLFTKNEAGDPVLNCKK